MLLVTLSPNPLVSEQVRREGTRKTETYANKAKSQEPERNWPGKHAVGGGAGACKEGGPCTACVAAELINLGWWRGKWLPHSGCGCALGSCEEGVSADNPETAAAKSEGAREPRFPRKVGSSQSCPVPYGG